MNPSALPARLAPQRTLQRGLEGVQNDFGFWLSNRVLIPMPSYDLGLGWEVPAGCERALGRGAFVTAMVRTWSTTLPERLAGRSRVARPHPRLPYFEDEPVQCAAAKLLTGANPALDRYGVIPWVPAP
jgi:hypothetical protein